LIGGRHKPKKMFSLKEDSIVAEVLKNKLFLTGIYSFAFSGKI